MNLKFLSLPETQRQRAIQEAAVRRGISPVIMEKDFWVCYILSILFRCDFGKSLVFKGATSLSKVFGAINRFSEDIDLSLSPEFLDLPLPGSSRNQANKWMTRAEAACIEMVRNTIMPELSQQVADALSTAKDLDRNLERIEFEIDSQTNSPVLLFHYPTTQPSGFDYLKRSVKLEFGSLTEQRPTGQHKVSTWLSGCSSRCFHSSTLRPRASVLMKYSEVRCSPSMRCVSALVPNSERQPRSPIETRSRALINDFHQLVS
jgi:hypothetical protein